MAVKKIRVNEAVNDKDFDKFEKVYVEAFDSFTDTLEKYGYSPRYDFNNNIWVVVDNNKPFGERNTVATMDFKMERG